MRVSPPRGERCGLPPRPVAQVALPGTVLPVPSPLDEQATLTALAGRVAAAPDALTELTALRALEREVQARTTACVQRARAAGASWAAVGEQLGCTRQAAAQRFTPPRPPVPATPLPIDSTPHAGEPGRSAAAAPDASLAAPPAAPGHMSPTADGEAAPEAVRAGSGRGRRPRRTSSGGDESLPPTFAQDVSSTGGRQEWLLTTPGGRLLLRAVRIGRAQ